MSIKKSLRLYTGEVVSDKMNKTRVVKVKRTFVDHRFKKVIKTFKKYKVHDESNSSKMGDTVEFYEGRPVSKTKYMYIHRILNTETSDARGAL